MIATVQLSEVATFRGLVGGPFGSSLGRKDYVDAGVPVVRGGNLGHGKWVGGEFAYVTPAKFEQDLARNSATTGDLVFTQRGTLGQVALVPAGIADEFVVSQSQMRLRVDATRFDAHYVYYACIAPDFVRVLSDRAISTGVPHINLGILAELSIPDRPLREQRAIAEVLGALDDKIAANDRLGALTDQYLEAEFGRVAVGAAGTTLSEIADVDDRSVKPAADGELRYLDIASVGVGRYDFPPRTRSSEAPSRARRLLRPGDTIWSTVRPNRRSHALVLDDDPLLIGSTGLAVLRSSRGQFATLYEATRRPEFVAFLESAAEGSAYPAVRPARFLEAPVPDISDDVADRFEQLASTLRRRRYAGVIESRTLAELRDTLLPALMSGRLSVKDAEATVSEVV